jgi:hypothetical protein
MRWEVEKHRKQEEGCMKGGAVGAAERERERVFCWLGEEGGGFNDASLKYCLGAGNEPMVQGAALDVLNSKG